MVVEQIALIAIMWHVEDKPGHQGSHIEFVKGSSSLTNPVYFYNKVTCLLDEQKDIDVISGLG